MFIIEVYKLGEFIGYSNGNWDYDDNDEKYPYTIPDMDFNRIGQWEEDSAERICADLKEDFPVYEFVVKELD